MAKILPTQPNPKVNFYVEKAKTWRDEKALLRTTILSCGLEEELKWGQACYTSDQNNIVLIHTFKAYCAVLFFKGALLKDEKGLLVQQTANVQSARQMRFTQIDEITKRQANLKSYILEAIKIEKSDVKVEFKKTDEFSMPQEFKNKLAEMPRLKKAFDALTPGRQRAYLLHFSAAKQAKTREARVEKYIPKILNDQGMDD